MKRTILLSAWLLVITASVSTFAQNAVLDSGESRTYDKEYNVVWKAVVQTLVDGGDTITSQDKESGTISTEWFTLKEAAIVMRGWRVKQNILVEKVSSSQTKVVLKLNFQNRIGKNEWRPASLDNDYTPLIRKAFFDSLSKRLGG